MIRKLLSNKLSLIFSLFDIKKYQFVLSIFYYYTLLTISFYMNILCRVFGIHKYNKHKSYKDFNDIIKDSDKTDLKVVIIGGGISGISGIKSCLEEGIKPICFIADSDIGGFWRYKTEGASIYANTYIDTDRDMNCYSDMPYKPSQSVVLHNKEVYEYLKRNVDEYNLRQYMTFNTRVTKIIRDLSVNPYSGLQRWIVEYVHDDIDDDKIHSIIVDGVMVATGRHGTSGWIPKFKGLESYEGESYHSSHYKNAEQLKNKNVCVVGCGNSGIDIACEVSQVTKCHHVVRSGVWIIKADGPTFFCREVQDRVTANLLARLPWWWQSALAEKQSTWLRLYESQPILNQHGLRPSHKLFQQHLLITGLCDPKHSLHNQLSCGKITVEKGIEYFTSDGIKFRNRPIPTKIDVVIFATGFRQAVKNINIDPNIVDLRFDRPGNDVCLYKCMFPIQTRSSSLVFINFLQSATFICADLQCRLYTRHLKGLVNLPSLKQQQKEMNDERTALCSRYLDKSQLRVQGGISISYYDELANMIGCNPSVLNILIERPLGLWAAFFTPFSCLKFRLVGPNAIDNTMKSIEDMYQSRFYGKYAPKDGPKNRGSIKGYMLALFQYIFLFVLVILAKLRGYDIGTHNRKVNDNLRYSRVDSLKHSYELNSEPQ